MGFQLPDAGHNRGDDDSEVIRLSDLLQTRAIWPAFLPVQKAFGNSRGENVIFWLYWFFII